MVYSLEVIGALKEEVEIRTNLKLNVLYIADRRDEIEFLQWTTRTIQSILNRDIDERQQLGIIEKRLEIMDTIEFENSLQERVLSQCDLQSIDSEIVFQCSL